jgi:hypothetical protein
VSKPAIKVEIAFNAGYSTPAASRVWTDVTAYVLPVHAPVQITRGRANELASVDASTLTLTLKNSDGRFTPGRAASPYYPNVKLNRPIRVTSTPVGGAASIRFVGYIDGWPLEWPAVVGTFATTTITATSRMARLGNAAPLSNIIAEEYRLDSPSAHYQLNNRNDATGNQSALQRTFKDLGGSGVAVNFTNATGPGTDGLTAATFAAGEWLVARWQPANSAAPVCTVEFFMLTSTPDRTILGAPDESASQTGHVFYCEVTAAGKLIIGESAGLTGSAWSLTSSATVSDGTTWHVAIVCDGSGTDLYLNGNLDSSTANNWAGFKSVLSVGGSPTYDTNVSIGFTPRGRYDGVLAHLAVYDHALTAGQVQTHAFSGLFGHADEWPGSRIQRYARFGGIPSAELVFDLDVTPPISHIDTTDQSPLELMQRVATTAGSLFFDGRDGNLRYRTRSHRYDAVAAFTLNIATGQLGPGVAPEMDAQDLLNDVKATLVGDTGLAVRAVKQDSVDEYGPRADQLELITEDVDAASDAAWWRVNTYAEPRARIPDLSCDLIKLPTATQASVLGADLGGMFTVTNWPTQSAAATASFFIEGYTETIGPESHTFSFNVSPAELWQETFKVADNPRGTLDSIYRIAY